ncbi:M48 family metalloprotease [Daejeonella sp. H1SJ63]|jgi:predicted Zn-dependent protease|uniref:M48 family metalloprotease n=1 Tax=Daejeonella sp. H1SJ63 TaxID=3034145 RepID=UPI0023EB08DB|nr:M48 family metalloprotease [Daejeonella sp. H1SJ63]
MKNFILYSCLSASLFLTNSCAVNPVTGKKQIVLMSEEQEIAMGKEADPEIVAQYGLYENKALQDFITQKGREMAAISHRPNLKYEFKIVDSEILNAFAVPGGYVYFTRGIMAHFNNEAEFAGVLGHEIGHITARHSVSQQTKAVLGQVGLIGSMILVPQVADFAQPLSQGLGLLFLKFGRDAERQSDELGVEYSSKIGYDAHEMAGFFNTLERKTAGTQAAELPDFLSTHPNPGERNVTVNNLSVEWKKKLNLKNPNINRESYLRRIEGLIYGEDPKQGFLEKDVFYHPELKFQFPTPAGWNYQNTPQRIQLAPKDGKALLMMTLGKGNTLQDVMNTVIKNNNLQVIESNQITLNGLNALAVIADVKPQQGQQNSSVRTMSYYIQYNQNIYVLLGACSSADFNSYSEIFSQTMKNFKELKDTSKLNKQPERIRIKTVKQSGTLKQALASYKISEGRMEELSILNGMQLTDNVQQGSLIKIIAN